VTLLTYEAVRARASHEPASVLDDIQLISTPTKQGALEQHVPGGRTGYRRRENDAAEVAPQASQRRKSRAPGAHDAEAQ
jgi:hypothetical protein